MIRKTCLAAFALAAGLTAAGAALAQTQTGSAAPPATSAQPAPPPWVQSAPPAIKPADPNTNQPTYSVDRPPDTPSGVYLPAAVLGYAKSAAGCVTIGCEDGPHAGGAPGPSSSGSPSSGTPSSGPPSSGPPSSAEPPPANLGTSGPH